MAKKTILKLLLALFFVLILLKNLFNREITSPVADQCKETNAGENAEWEILDNRFLIRRKAVYYLADEEAFKLLAFSGMFIAKNLIFGVKFLNLRLRTVRYLNLTKFTKERVHCSNKFQQCLFMLTVPFQYHLMGDIKDLSEISIEIKLYDTLNNKTNYPIEVTVKSKKNYLINKGRNTQKTALCAKSFNLTDTDFNNFKWWVKMHKLIGYSKIIIYNTLGLTEKYKVFYEKHRGFLEIRNYQKIPKMINGKIDFVKYSEISADFEERSFAAQEVVGKQNKTLKSGLLKGVIGDTGLTNFNKIKYASERDTHEIAAINECFLSTFSDYDRVAIYDINEFILPAVEDEKPQIEDIEGSLIFNELDCNKSIDKYMVKINSKNLQNIQSVSTNFNQKLFIEQTFLTDIYKQLLLFFSKNENFNQKANISVFYKPNEVNYIFLINNTGQFYYAKNLLNAIKLYMKEGKDLAENDSIWFNRAFTLEGVFNTKAIHHLSEFETVTQNRLHGKKHQLEWTVPYSHGYTALFQREFNYQKFMKKPIFSINQLKLDLFYFNCILMKRKNFA